MLKAKKKIKVTKKDLKEDKFILTVFKIQEYFKENVKLLSSLVIGIIVIIALFTYISKDKAQREQFASVKYSEALKYFGSADEAKGLSILDTIVTKYSATKVSIMANLKLANSFIEKNDYSKAKMYFNNIIDEGTDIDFILSAAYCGVADCYFNEDNMLKAAENYKNASEIIEDKETGAQYLYAAAVAYEKAQKMDDFKETLTTITNEFSETKIKNDAEKILASLK